MRRLVVVCAVAAGALYAQEAAEMLMMMRTGPVETAYDLGVASATAELYEYMQRNGLMSDEDALEAAAVAADGLRRACGQTAALKGLGAAVRLRVIANDSVGTGSPEGDRVALAAFEVGVARLEELGRELCSLETEPREDRQR
ncbi:MAG: hypothetical protein F4X98_10985 [Gammaproteobacteria bacterium]|nr:hypothetical protein [Gammaproteobacteria bacterium]